MKKITIFALVLTIVTSMLLISCGNGSTNTDSNNSESTAPENKPEFPDTPSEGFEISQIDDQTCMITGIGTCTDTMVRIPSEINGLKVTEVYGGNAWRRNYSADPITGILFPDSVTKIVSYEDTYSFSYKLEQIVLPDTPIVIGEKVFEGTPYFVNEANWTNGVLYIGNHLVSVRPEVGDTIVVRDGTLDIARHAFYASEAEHVVIPNSVVFINSEAFMHCENLVRLTIGKGVTYIGEDALYHCDAFRKIAYVGTETEWRSIEKDGMRGGTTPTDYEVIYNWSDTDTGTTVVPGTTDVKYFTFELNEDNASYKVGVNRDYMGQVNEYHIPAEYEGLPVTSVGLFGGMPNITVITLPDSVTSVDAFAFGNNVGLTTIRLSSSLTVLPDHLCSGCDKLSSVVIPASVTTIESDAFGSCIALSDIRFEGTVAQWNAVVKGAWWYSGAFEADLAKNVTCSDGVAELFPKVGIQVTEAEWNAMIAYKNFKNVTIDVAAEFLDESGSGNSTYHGTIKNAGDVIKVYGELITRSDEVLAYRQLYFEDFIIGLAKDFGDFEFDAATGLYVAKEPISFSASIHYPSINWTESANITATDVKIELDDTKRIAKIALSMTQEVDVGDDFPMIVVVSAVLTLSDYGTTTMQ